MGYPEIVRIVYQHREYLDGFGFPPRSVMATWCSWPARWAGYGVSSVDERSAPHGNRESGRVFSQHSVNRKAKLGPNVLVRPRGVAAALTLVKA